MDKVFIEQLVNELKVHHKGGPVPNIADVLATTNWENPGVGAYEVWVTRQGANRIVQAYKESEIEKENKRAENQALQDRLTREHRQKKEDWEQNQEKSEREFAEKEAELKRQAEAREKIFQDRLEIHNENVRKAEQEYKQLEQKLDEERQQAYEKVRLAKEEREKAEAATRARVAESNRQAEKEMADFFARHNAEKVEFQNKLDREQAELKEELAKIDLTKYTTPKQLAEMLDVSSSKAIALAKKHLISWQFIKNPVLPEPGTSYSPELYVITAEEAQTIVNLENAAEDAEEAKRVHHQQLVEKARQEREEKRKMIEQLNAQNEAVRRFVKDPKSDEQVVGWIKSKQSE